MAADELPSETGLRNLWRFTVFSKPYWKWLLGGFVAGLVRMVLHLYLPIFVKNVIDGVLMPAGLTTAERLRILWGMIPPLAGLLVVHSAATVGRMYFPQVAASNAVVDIRFALFRHLQRLSLAFHTKRPSGTVVARVISDVAVAQDAFDLVIIQTSQQIMIAVVIAVYLLYRDPLWALVPLCTLPFFVGITQRVRQPMRRASRKQRESVERMSGHLQERISMIREVQAFTAEPHEEHHLLGEAETLRKHTLRQRLLQGYVLTASEVTRTIGLIAVIAFGVYRVTAGHASVGDVTAFYLYSGMLLMPVQALSDLYMRLHVAAASADRVFEFLDSQPAIRELPAAKSLAANRPPEVVFENVSFSYPADSPIIVLNNVSFRAVPGMRMAFVGESGAGKSTLISLLPRFYDIQKGRILIDGQEVRSVKLQSLRESIGIVPQEPVLFTGTIRENILYGRRGATHAEMRAAARAANAEPFIIETSSGYDAVIGERGVGLSGGQIQRIAIARAFLKDPAILILDEATSNLDATSESLVLEALDRLEQGRTCFTIAHRLSIARSADVIIVLKDGQIAETGTHDELLAREGAYYELWKRQVGEAME
ncbi:MAG TPA: ABC transporter ATP-binding protein [Planctomycetota bacterium]|nr:ABC transporter ATP-binding protein [Planctomycetota bacterium]